MSSAGRATGPGAVAAALRASRQEGSGALIGYLPAGYPDRATCVDAAVALADNGVDIIELGIPYSDPVMDGPVIQAATGTALRGGFRLRDTFGTVEEIVSRAGIPVLVMTYWNPVLQYGADRFADQLASAGGSGLITPDLVPDEGGEWLTTSERTGLDRVFLAAPSSSDVRLRRAVEASRGFVYAVSTLGITGTRNDVDAAARLLVTRLRAVGAEQACVGIGISTAEHVAEVLDYADGAIVGSALVKALGEGGVSGLAATAAALARGKNREK